MPMMAIIAARQPPVATFGSQGIALTAYGAIEFLVLPSGGSPVNVFTLGLNASTTVEVHFRVLSK